MVIAGLGVGPSMPLFTLAIQNAVDVRFVGQATSASQFFRQTGATVGAALMGTVLATTLGVAFAAVELPPELSGTVGGTAEQFVSTGGAELPDRIRAAFGEEAREAPTEERAQALMREGEEVATRTAAQVRNAFTVATSRIYWLTAGIMVVAALLSLRIPEIPLRTTHDRIEAVQSDLSGD
jgi:hypothetical protein